MPPKGKKKADAPPAEEPAPVRRSSRRTAAAAAAPEPAPEPAPAPAPEPAPSPVVPASPAPIVPPSPIAVPPSPAPAFVAAATGPLSAAPSVVSAVPFNPASASAAAAAAAAASPGDDELDELDTPPPPPTPAAPMEATQATASQGSMTSVEGLESDPLTFTTYRIVPATPEGLTERLNGLTPEFGEKSIPFAALKPAGERTPIFAFTVARVKPGTVYGGDYSLETGDPEKVALLGLVTLYAGEGGYLNAKLVVLATRLTLLPLPEEGFVPDRYIAFALPKLAAFLRGGSQGRPVLIRVARKQTMSSPEYLGTLGTLATLGFAYSRYNAARERVKFKLVDVADPVDYGQVEAVPKEGDPESVVYKYAAPGKITYDEAFTFTSVESVQVERPGRMEASASVELVADAAVVEGFSTLPVGKDITIPDSVLADREPMPPRRGGKRTTYRKKARTGKTAKRRR